MVAMNYDCIEWLPTAQPGSPHNYNVSLSFCVAQKSREMSMEIKFQFVRSDLSANAHASN